MNRILPLEGGRNFRDLGGYPAADGRRVRWARLFRSGVLAYLTPNDQAYLNGIGIRVLCDFRTARERAREPISWRGPDLSALHWDYDPKHVSLSHVLGSVEGLTQERAREAMLGVYRELPFFLQGPYSELFSRLAAGNLPLVFGCSAGKDRTGVAAALVLVSLGVPWPHVVADFRLTESAVDLERVLTQHPRDGVGIGDGELLRLAHLPRAIRAPLLAAAPEYIDAAFDSIRAAHGSVDAYLRERLGVAAAALAQIRANLLE